MTFANPEYLALLAALPVAAALAYLAARSRRRSLERLGEPRLVNRLTDGVNGFGRTAAAALTLCALALAIVALARPQWGESVQTVERQGVQIMVALDISRSMLAEDLEPNRLTRAKLEIADLMNRVHGDELGLVLFSGAAFVQFPLTFDYATARNFLENVSPAMISRQGTAIADAIEKASTGFDDSRPSQKVILIISDGENHEEDPVAAARRAADDGIVIYTIGIGSAEGGTIPIYDNFSGLLLGNLADRNGNTVISRLDEDTLASVAQAGGGRFIRADGFNNAAAEFARELEDLQKATIESEIETARVERFQIFAVAAIALLIAAGLIADRRRGARKPAESAGAAANRLTLGMMALPLLSFTLLSCGVGDTLDTRGPRDVESGNLAFDDGDYEQALQDYDRALDEMPDSPEAMYNSANALYRQAQTGEQAQMSDAVSRYDRASRNADSELAARSAYNTGNALFETGNALIGMGDSEGARQSYGQALESYKQALRLNPDDEDAKRNLELTLRQLQQPEEQQQQQGEEEQPEDQQGEEGENEDPQNQGQNEDQQENPNQDQQDGQNDQQQENEQQDAQDQQGQPDDAEAPQQGSESQQAQANIEEMTEQQAEQLLESAGSSDTLRSRLLDEYLFLLGAGIELEQNW